MHTVAEEEEEEERDVDDDRDDVARWDVLLLCSSLSCWSQCIGPKRVHHVKGQGGQGGQAFRDTRQPEEKGRALTEELDGVFVAPPAAAVPVGVKPVTSMYPKVPSPPQ